MAKNLRRREQLGNAAIEVLAREGGRGLTHRAVDRQAGLPEGTTANYYPSREALLEATALRINARRWADYQNRRADSHGRSGLEGLGDALHATLRAALTTNRSRCLAVLELSLEGARRPELAQVLLENRRAQEQVIEEILAASGAAYSEQARALLTTWVYGTILWLLTRPPAESTSDDAEALAHAAAQRFWGDEQNT